MIFTTTTPETISATVRADIITGGISGSCGFNSRADAERNTVIVHTHITHHTHIVVGAVIDG